jgi:hypothetical protein
MYIMAACVIGSDPSVIEAYDWLFYVCDVCRIHIRAQVRSVLHIT